MTTNLTDEAIDNMRATMAASSALGAIAAAIWERASDPAAHEALIAELNAELMDLVNDDSEANEWYPQDYLQQQAIMELVAKAMIAQHLFSEGAPLHQRPQSGRNSTQAGSSGGSNMKTLTWNEKDNGAYVARIDRDTRYLVERSGADWIAHRATRGGSALEPLTLGRRSTLEEAKLVAERHYAAHLKGG